MALPSRPRADEAGRRIVACPCFCPCHRSGKIGTVCYACLSNAPSPRRKKRGIAMWLRHGSWLLMMGMLWGCAMVNGTPPEGSAPLFQADATDPVILQTVQREQETLLSTCTLHQSCDQVHFTRAMVALFQNREVAVASFQQAIAAAPNGPFADSSAIWIRFLANRTVSPASADKPNGALLEAMKGTVRTRLGRQRVAVETARSLDPDRKSVV